MTRVEAAIAELLAALQEDAAAKSRPAAPDVERLYSIEEAAELLGIGRTLAYQEIQAGRLRSIRVGRRRRLVPSSALADYIAAAGR